MRRRYLSGVLLAALASTAAAQAPDGRRIWIGPPARIGPHTTNNGLPSQGINRYMDYSWPSLREALAQYGFCGKRIGPAAVPLTVPPRPPGWGPPPPPAPPDPAPAPRRYSQ